MIRTVVIDGVRYKIDQADVLGAGGEATVVKTNNSAVKIYHKPDPARIEKLKDFVAANLSLPDAICAPQKLAYDTAGNIVGFTMRLMTGHNEVVKKLSSKSHRKANPHLTSKVVVNLMLDGYKTISACHPNVIIGDNNDLNVLYNDRFLTYIDADSFQFGDHPCMVGTEEFLPPELYNLDLSTKPYYKPQHDWYSWFCMFIRSVLMTHPYGGVHLKYASIPQRALARVTVFDSEVKYPKVALSPDVLDDNLRALFERMFKKGERFTPPPEAFAEYRDSLVTCNSCDTMYPSERKSCPQCSTVNTQQIQRKVKVSTAPGKRTVHSEELLTTAGEFIWHKLHHKNLFAISLDKGRYLLHRKVPDQVPEVKELFKAKSKSVQFDMFDGQFLVVSEDPTDKDVMIFDTTGSQIKGITKKPVSTFGGEKVFSGGQDRLYRVYEGFLLRCQFSLKYGTMTDENINAVIKNQTWISASPYGSTVFGLQRAFNVFTYFVYSFDKNPKGEFWTKSLTDLEDNESVIDIATYFCGSSILLMLKTEITGKTFTRVYVLKEDQQIIKYRVPALASDTHRNIHGKAFMFANGKGVILHPTDDGIVQEMLAAPDQPGAQSLMSETEPFIAESDSLLPYEKGIIVVGDKQINHITLK